jgi:aspartate 1-decarboxylase
MKRLFQLSLVLLSMSAIVIITSRQALTKSSGSPLANTGSPGDGSNNTCAKNGCHVGVVNSFQGSVTIDVSDIPLAGYAPGKTYTIGVTVAEAGRSTFGFQLTSEDAKSNKIGSYTSSAGVRLEFDDWVTHSINSGTGVWAITWTAPTGTQDVTFYAAGNAANSNGTSAGDHIYTGSATVSRDLLASVNDIVDNPDFKIYNVYNEKTLVVESEKAAVFNVYSINGRHVESFRVNRGSTRVNLSNLRDGQYIVSEEKGKFATRIVIK